MFLNIIHTLLKILGIQDCLQLLSILRKAVQKKWKSGNTGLKKISR